MKIFIAFFLLFFCLRCFAQTDSTEIKLQRYQDLHDKGLITDEEYDLLKKKELNLESAPPASKKDSISLADLKKKYKGQFIGGSTVFALGGGFIGLGIYLKDKLDYYTDNHGRVQVRDYKKPAKFSFVCGGLTMVFGTFVIIKGIMNKEKYLDRISIGPTSASITFKAINKKTRSMLSGF